MNGRFRREGDIQIGHSERLLRDPGTAVRSRCLRRPVMPDTVEKVAPDKFSTSLSNNDSRNSALLNKCTEPIANRDIIFLRKNAGRLFQQYRPKCVIRDGLKDGSARPQRVLHTLWRYRITRRASGRGGEAGRTLQQGRNLRRRDSLTEQVALPFRATVRFETGELFGVFDAFGGYR
jgi:hypothetical protein